MKDGPRNRSSRGRIMRWNEDKDQLLILALDNICKKNSFGIPWNEVAALIDPKATGGAVEQHVAKLRKRRLDQGQNVPPLRRLQRGPQSDPVRNKSKSKKPNSADARRVPVKTKLKTTLSRHVDDEGSSDDDMDYESDYEWEDRKLNDSKVGQRHRVVSFSRTNSSSDDSPGASNDREFLPRRAKCARNTEALSNPSCDDEKKKLIVPSVSIADAGICESQREEHEIAGSKNELSHNKSSSSMDDSKSVQYSGAHSMIVKLPVTGLILDSLNQEVVLCGLDQKSNDASLVDYPEVCEGEENFNDGAASDQQIRPEKTLFTQHPHTDTICRDSPYDAGRSYTDDNSGPSNLSAMLEPLGPGSWPSTISYSLPNASMLGPIGSADGLDMSWVSGHFGLDMQLPEYQPFYTEVRGGGSQSTFLPFEAELPQHSFIPENSTLEEYANPNEENAGMHGIAHEHDSDPWQFIALPYH